MVNKLRKKFILTSMLALLVILLVMIGVINLANLHHMISDADNLLTMLSDNDGNFPGMIDFNGGPDPNVPPDKNQQSNPFQLDRLYNIRSAEMPFQSRYFWVKYNPLSNTTIVNIEHTATVTEETALSYADEVLATSKKDRGFYHNYRYRINGWDNGTALVIFTDMSTPILNALTLLLQTVLIGMCALVAMFILVFLFSGKAVAPVVESLEKQKRFITDAGHELKTPLAVISANVDVLELESGKSEWTDSIRNQTKRMNGLVKNLLTLSRMDEERMHVVFSDFDLSATIKETASSFEALATSKELKYQMDIEDGIHITGDKNSINQLESLLLDNATKYCSEKGSIHVILSSSKYITFEVSNTCDSIPSGNLDRLFDRFYRADSSRARETGGYGIGLSVARAIANSHGGSIEALRDGDKIIRFVVTLPKLLPKSLTKNS
ncbi:sensor histidine kinase [Butyrivibrio proteoclasticus]|uniref:sensor histidine kinase n=1 Tax=Butyrivibrio proteoclasticus TaxID=43305 RepID=UPI0006882BDC|nr:HAMP domain-containing sensor histidine kinase [Butyrivibrio proteoclasticus]